MAIGSNIKHSDLSLGIWRRIMEYQMENMVNEMDTGNMQGNMQGELPIPWS